LIGNKHLTTPKGFQTFAESAIQKCEVLVQKTLSASTVAEYGPVAKDLDRVSDLLCRVIDLSDFIRATHPDLKWARAATEAYALVFEYMNVYNTETRLNAQLKKALSMPEVISQWTNEERTVAEILMKDFARSGIDLPAEQREKFVSLSNEISESGTAFVSGMEFANDHVVLDSTQLSGVDPTLVQKLTWWNKAVVPLHDQSARIVAGTAHDEAARRAIYVADRTASKKSINRLQKLLLKRAQLAKLTGYASYGQMTLVDKMAKTPESVNNFLTTLNASNRGQMRKEIDHLLEAKRFLDGRATTIQPWDHGFYLNRLMQLQSNTASRTSRSRLYEMLPSFFSPGNVIAGLSQLFYRLYGVRFVANPVSPGECWDPDVRRLNVVTESQEHCCPLLRSIRKAGKASQPCTFHSTLLARHHGPGD
jgi:intermediate peptidase